MVKSTAFCLGGVLRVRSKIVYRVLQVIQQHLCHIACETFFADTP